MTLVRGDGACEMITSPLFTNDVKQKWNRYEYPSDPGGCYELKVEEKGGINVVSSQSSSVG
jgi:hypothetical protein